MNFLSPVISSNSRLTLTKKKIGTLSTQPNAHKIYMLFVSRWLYSSALIFRFLLFSWCVRQPSSRVLFIQNVELKISTSMRAIDKNKETLIIPHWTKSLRWLLLFLNINKKTLSDFFGNEFNQSHHLGWI